MSDRMHVRARLTLCRSFTPLVLGALAISGCASHTGEAAASKSTEQGATPHSQVTLPEQSPPDFALSVTVATPDPTRDPSTLARWQRPARYIVEPGGTFRAAVRPGARVDAYPPPIRTLSRAQIESLWASVRADSWMNDPPAGSKSASSPQVETLPPEVQRRSALVWISAGGLRRGVVVPLAAGSAESDAAARLIDQLADLAWVKK
ncbi:MAG: hypothetical protein IT432_06200 [Phycisphaerales bacterium]|nr:hypothetical protein [Phycisphaerales bacterium]